MRDRLLVRHFLWRFLEHDFISANADRREALSVVGGAVISISLFFSALIAIEYQFSNFMPPGIASQQSVDDRFMFVTSSMFVMALLAVALWDALALDARDTAVLGILPLPRAVIVRSKYCAVALVAGAADLAWNLAPTLFRSASVPITLPIGFRGGLVLTLAQGTVTVAAGAFGFLSVNHGYVVYFGILQGKLVRLCRFRDKKKMQPNEECYWVKWAIAHFVWPVAKRPDRAVSKR